MSKGTVMKKPLFTLFICIALAYPVYTQNRNTQPQTTKNIADGYGNVKWGSFLSDVRNNVLGRIAYTDEKSIIVSRDGEIEYRYGFFYPEHNQTAETPQPKLFYVVIQFPHISLDDLKKKMVEKYGPPTGETIKNNQGAYIWESESTSIVLWIDNYENKPFARKITYLSKIMARDINQYHTLVFSRKEQEILRKLQP